MVLGLAAAAAATRHCDGTHIQSIRIKMVCVRSEGCRLFDFDFLCVHWNVNKCFCRHAWIGNCWDVGCGKDDGVGSSGGEGSGDDSAVKVIQDAGFNGGGGCFKGSIFTIWLKLGI